MKIYGYLLAILATSCDDCLCQINIGGNFEKKRSLSEELSLVSAGSVKKVYVVLSENIEYRIALDASNVITYIETKDESFETAEGVKVNMTFNELRRALGKVRIIDEKGWAKYVRLASGWCAAFTFEDSFNDSSKVLFLFKRKSRLQ